MSALLAAGATAKTALATVAMAAAQGTVVAIAAFALMRALRLRPAWQAAMWLIVIAKFALPWGPAMPWSLSDLIAALRDHGAHDLIVAPTIAAEPVAATTGSPWIAAGWLALAAIWLAGAAIVIVRAIGHHRAAARAARRAPSASAADQALLAELATLAGVRAPRLAIGADAIGPHVVGVWRAIVVVPAALLADRALLRAALLHELAHVRRRDALARILQIWVGAVYFWWPVARVVGRRLEAAREAACDAWALDAGELPRASYARLLVRMAALHAPHVHAHALAAIRTPGALDVRVAAVLAPPARGRARIIHKLALLAWAALVLGGARTASARGHAPTCVFSPQLAESLRLAHPEADRDGDGVLSPDEACELEAELSRKAAAEPPSANASVSVADAELAALLAEPLGCKLPSGEATSSPDLSPASVLGSRLPAATCQQVEGAER